MILTRLSSASNWRSDLIEDSIAQVISSVGILFAATALGDENLAKMFLLTPEME